ncbi:Chymase [Manis pentadactyla]|nr:Chymase [Manis pentadactyla]
MALGVNVSIGISGSTGHGLEVAGATVTLVREKRKRRRGKENIRFLPCLEYLPYREGTQKPSPSSLQELPCSEDESRGHMKDLKGWLEFCLKGNVQGLLLGLRTEGSNGRVELLPSYDKRLSHVYGSWDSVAGSEKRIWSQTACGWIPTHFTTGQTSYPLSLTFQSSQMELAHQLQMCCGSPQTAPVPLVGAAGGSLACTSGELEVREKGFDRQYVLKLVNVDCKPFTKIQSYGFAGETPEKMEQTFNMELPDWPFPGSTLVVLEEAISAMETATHQFE